MLSTYLSYDLIARDIGKAIDRVERQPVVDREADYYREDIGKVKTIEEFVEDDRLFKFAMKAHGLGDMDYAKAFMVKVLKEGISDPDSFANKLTDKRYLEFATTYNFERYGELATSFNRAQHDAPGNYAAQVALGALQQGFDFVENEVTYYVSNIANVKSIDDLMADTRLLNVALYAFGLDATTETPARIREMLEGGVTDPNSPANQLGDKRFANFVAAFDFVQYGDQTTTRAEVQDGVPRQFVADSGLSMVKPRAEFIEAEADYYTAGIGKVKSIDDLLDDQRLLRVAMSAYGLDADAEDPKRIREMLAGGVTDPQSPANKLTDKSYAAFVSAFDFVEHGEATTTRDAATKDTLRLYTLKSELGLVTPNRDYIAAETAYYKARVVTLTSIDDLMADKRLLNFALTSYGLDPSLETPERVRQMLEGGVTDPKSPANQLSDKTYVAFVTAFNFARYGETATTRTPAMEPAVDLYLRQTLEEDAGRQNEGVRLALYFERKAGDIDSVFEILADPALSRVVRTALGIPESMASADIDRQAAMIEARLDLAELKDPEALGKFLQRFASLWEIDNPSAPQHASVAILFAQPAEYGVSTDLLLSMQKLRF